MVLRALIACLLALLALLSPAAGMAEVRPSAVSAEWQQGSGAPAPAEPAVWHDAVELRLAAEAASEPGAWLQDSRLSAHSSRMEVPTRADARRYRGPALAGIERPPRAAAARA